MVTSRCLICAHPSRAEIDREIGNGCCLAKVAKTFGVEYDSLYNHSLRHVVKNNNKIATVQNFDVASAVPDVNLLSEVDYLLKNARAIFDRNLQSGNDTTALKSLTEQRSILELLAKVSYSLHQVRILELEQLKIQSGEGTDAANMMAAEGLKALTDEELKEYDRILNKAIAAGKKWFAEYMTHQN